MEVMTMPPGKILHASCLRTGALVILFLFFFLSHQTRAQRDENSWEHQTGGYRNTGQVCEVSTAFMEYEKFKDKKTQPSELRI